MKITALLIFKKTKIQKKCIYLIAMEQKATSQTSSVRIVFMSRVWSEVLPLNCLAAKMTMCEPKNEHCHPDCTRKKYCIQTRYIRNPSERNQV